MIKRGGAVSGRMAAAICLFYFCALAQSPCEVAPTLGDYVSRLAGADASGELRSFSNRADTAADISVSATLGYDYVYRDVVHDTNNVELRDFFVRALDGSVAFAAAPKAGKGGVRAVWDFRRLDARFGGKSYDFSEESELRLNRIALGGWTKTGNVSFNGAMAIDPRLAAKANDEHVNYGKKIAAAWTTPGLDIHAACVVAGTKAAISCYYLNSAIPAADNVIENSSNGASRSIPLVIDENRFGASLEYAGEALSLNLDGAFAILGGAVDSISSSFLPLSIRGYGAHVKTLASARRIVSIPGIHFRGSFYGFDITGHDGDGGEYLGIGWNDMAQIDAGIDFHPGRRSLTGAFLSWFTTHIENGRISLYPFTNWLYLLDLPDRYRIYDLRFYVFEGGVRAVRSWRPHERHILKSDAAITGCRIRGAIENARQVRYMGILPIYENHVTDSFACNEYVVIKAKVAYSYRFRTHDVFLAVGQTVPIDVSGGGNLRQSSTITRRLYGGLRIECGVTLLR